MPRLLELLASCVVGCVAVLLAGCASASREPGENPAGYKYQVVYQSPDGVTRTDGIRRPGDRELYRYAMRRSDLEAMSTNQAEASRVFISRRGPPPCESGFVIVKVGDSENGGAWALVKCKESLAQ